MSDKAFLELPVVTDDDIHWVSSLLKTQFDVPRQEALKAMETLDVAACPGSGKTTLLVAKLAILAKKWRYRTRGLCVLSHTNVARQEIESRLGNTTFGRRLLSYPHFIGTIHGFVNDFLAMPWLRSQGYPIKMIDTAVCLNRRWNSLSWKIRNGLEKNHHGPSVLTIKAFDFDLGEIRWSKGTLGRDTSTYKEMREACQLSTREGYFCHDEMFVWAEALMSQYLNFINVIRDRFPYLLIDEAQDNSEEQSAVLHRIFTEGSGAVIRQRFGDGNQAIYHSLSAKEVTTEIYKFPANKIVDLPNSHRFGQQIANLADPLGLIPHEDGLKGQRPAKPLESGLSAGQHTIFLFDKTSAKRVLNAYAELLLGTFSEKELMEGKFAAVGQIHRPPDEESDNKFPHHVKDYWDAYDPEITRPSTFVHHVLAGQEKATTHKLTHPAIEMIAEGILRLAKMGKGGNGVSLPHQRHRNILELLKQSGNQGDYEEFVFRFAVKRETLKKEVWESNCRKTVKKIAEAIAGVSLYGQDVDAFLGWALGSEGYGSIPVTGMNRSNIYSYPNHDPKVHIRVGSIHSVKGQTHTATLVLETFWQDTHKPPRHNLELLLPWLCCDQCGCSSKTGVQQRARLKLHYVAMTRPTDLLCLAMKQSSVSEECQQKLKACGWDVRSI